MLRIFFPVCHISFDFVHICFLVIGKFLMLMWSNLLVGVCLYGFCGRSFMERPSVIQNYDSKLFMFSVSTFIISDFILKTSVRQDLTLV